MHSLSSEPEARYRPLLDQRTVLTHPLNKNNFLELIYLDADLKT